jgi:hypothetical protein
VSAPELPLLAEVADEELDALVASMDAALDASFLGDVAAALARARAQAAEEKPAAVA